MKWSRITALLIALQVSFAVAFAQASYYEDIDGTKGGATLKTALYNLIKSHKQISYGSGSNNTWGAFYTTDAVIENGKRRVLDMYSDETRYFGNKGDAISGMNIEHSVAKSWWGGTKNNAYCDLHHLNPSDQTANSRKSNYPLGELTSVSWDNGVTFVGKADIDGKSQNAYEPCDEYKGDFARTFMYMFTCYQDLTWEYTWMNYEKSAYPTLKPWAVKLLLKWHKQDPVSEKEVNRNNAVYEVQGNRNPYIDYPQLADYVWGDSVSYTFYLNGDVEDGTGGEIDSEIEIPDGYYLKFIENFEEETVAFEPVNVKGSFPWIFEYQCGEVTSYDDNDIAHDAESWLVSEPLDFSGDSIAKINFDYVIRFCMDSKVGEYNRLLISADYSGDINESEWETLDFGAAQNSTDWTRTTTEYIEIPASYMGNSNVVIAFSYIGTAAQAGTFEIDNVKIVAAEGANDGESTGSGNEGEGGSGNDGNGGNFTQGGFTLVTDEEQLTIGDSILIVYENFTMGQSAGNYRYKTDISTSNGNVTWHADDAQKIVLEEGAIDGTFALNVGDGYLAATSSSSNHLITTAAIDENGSWLITIDSNSLATIMAQGDKTRNTIQYNTGSPRFSCYKGGQKSVNIYAKSPVATSVEVIAGNEDEFVDVYTLTGICLRRHIERRNALEGLEKGIYICGKKKITVK